MSKRTVVAVALIGGAALLALWLPGLPADTEPGAADPGEVAVRPPGTGVLIERLRRTNLLNGEEIHRRLGPGGDMSSLGDPESVRRWHASLPRDTEVCGVRFAGPERVDYRLQTFPDRASALAAGFVVTHRHHCGACSSLRDLANYLAQPDLTTPARTCARRWTAAGIEECFREEIGFGERCAATWTRNALRTRRRCAATCIAHYGLWNLVTNDIRAPNTDEHGNLNPCLRCDERVSGPGFQYAAGRTRRSSGLTSAIARPATEIYPVDHRLYFR